MADPWGWLKNEAVGAWQTVDRNAIQPVANTVNRDVVQPVAQAATSAVHAVQNAPQTVQNDVVSPFQRDVVRPIMRAPQNFVNNVAAPVDRWAVQSPFGRGAQAVGLGLLQTGVEGAQGIAGLTDALNHRLGNYSGVSPFTQKLTNVAKGIDATAKAEHANPVLYHGAQVGGNLLGMLAGTTEAKAATEAAANVPKVGAVVRGVANVGAKAEQGVNDLTKGLRSGNAAQRVIGNAIVNGTKPGYQAANAAFTGLQSGQQIANGRKVTPLSVGTNLAVGGVGFPVAGAVTHEVTAPVISAVNNKVLPEVATAIQNKVGAAHSHMNLDMVKGSNGTLRARVSPDTAKQVIAANTKKAVGDVNQLAKEFSTNHPIGLSTGAVDENGNKLGLDGKPLGTPKPSTPEQIGKALGMSNKDIQAAKATSPRESAPLELHQSKSGEIQTANREQPTGKRSGLQNRQTPNSSKGASSGQTSARSYKGKYTTNTTKVNIPEVKSGDYQKVRSNAQLVQSVVHNHAQGVIHAMQKIPKSELQSFWHKVEDTSLPRSKAMQEAITRWHGLSDTVHATSQALGGDTPHLANYARHNWDLADPNQRALYEQLLQERVKDSNYSPQDFKGLDNKPRAFNTIKQGEAAGFKLKNTNPINDVAEYAQKSKNQLKTQAVAKGMNEAEAHLPASDKSETQTIGYKKSIETTKQGVKELQSLYPSAKSTNKALVGYRKLNHGAKQFLLSVSQFHPININMQAAPALALKGHPVKAVRGLIDTAASINKKYSDSIMQGALHDGTLENGARIGSPVATGNDFSTSGKLDVKAGLGERAIFERQLPAMHVQMIRAVVSDLKKRGISLDSVEARKAGTTINEIMGYVNTEMRNLSPTVQRGLGDVLLAPQFTRSKWQVLGDAFTKGGQAGSYARAAVAGKYAAEAAITLAVGAALGQKSDNLKDVLIRTLVHPSIPTPFKDKKGNTIELGLPHNYISEAGNLVGSLNRGTNGRLGISVNPGNIPGNLRDYGKGRLAIVPGDALKIATNTDFANKPLYDPTANLKTQVAQGATTLLSGHLPIGVQGAMYTNAVKSHLPQSVQQVLDAGSPGTNPILKSVASSFGATARTDKTVGKGQQSTQYFGALDNAAKGLNRQEKDALDLYTGGKKNPVTGQYQIMPTANDTRTKSVALLQNPKVIDHLIQMNGTLKSQGQSVDPLWSQSKANIVKYLQYQAMPPGGADKADWMNKNKTWYSPLSTARNTFFNSLPAGDPNKPQLSIKYPTPAPALQSALDQYSKLTNSTAKGNFLDSHPEVVQQWNKVSDYNNQLRQAQGYAPLKNYPTPSDQVQKFMTAYNAADKGTRKAIRNGHPQNYQNMIAYYDALDLYNINHQGAVSQLQGEPDQTSKQNKAIHSLAQDIYKNPDGTYSIVPAGWMNGLGSGGSYGYGGGGKPLTAAGAALRFAGHIPAPKIANPTKMPIIKSSGVPKVVLKKYTPTMYKVSKSGKVALRRGIV